MYSKFLESIIILSPFSINGGTVIFKPLSSSAGLYDEETVVNFNSVLVDDISFTLKGAS